MEAICTYGRPEDSRVKIPALVHFTRLGYTYMSIKDKERNVDYDGDANIFYSQFLSAINRINHAEFTLDDAKKIIDEIKIKLDNDDLGKSFFNILQSGINDIKLIDFDDESGAQNDYTVVTELPYENGDDNFRPDITVLINGMPLSFIEVKRQNNREGILTERNRMERRFGNKIYRRFVGITQLLCFPIIMSMMILILNQYRGHSMLPAVIQECFSVNSESREKKS